MKKKLFGSFLMVAVLVAGLFGLNVKTSDVKIASVEAVSEDVNYADVHSSSLIVNESSIRQFANYENEGSELISKSLVRYYYFIEDTEVTGNSASIAVEDGDKLTYRVEKKTASRAKIYHSWTWSAQEEIESGEFEVRAFNYVNVAMDSSALENATAQFPIITGHFEEESAGVYKVDVNGGVTLELDTDHADYNITINDVPYDGGTYIVNNINEDVNINVKYVKETDAKINFDANTLNSIKNGDITLKIGDTLITETDAVVPVAENSEVSIVATASKNVKIDSITCNGEVRVNTGDYAEYKAATFIAETKGEYNVSVVVSDATNTIVCDKDNVKIEIDGGWAKDLVDVLPRDTEVTLIIKVANNEYVSNFSVENANVTNSEYVDGDLRITFTTGVCENYVLDFERTSMFQAEENDVEINIYDILLMHEAEEKEVREEYKTVTYEALFNDVFSNNVDGLTVEDVKFEYLAGVYPISKDLNWEFYFPVEKASATNKDELIEYAVEKYGSWASYVITDSVVNEIIPILHRFGTSETRLETVKLVYTSQNEKYKDVEILGSVATVDQREVAELDINETITVGYGNYDDALIMEKILENRMGVVTHDDPQMPNLNAELSLSNSLVGKDAGEHTVTISFNDGNYFYICDSKTVTVIIEKADAIVEIPNNVINYELVENGTVNKDYIVTIESSVLPEDKVDNVYFVMGLDIVDGELIAKVDLSNMSSSSNDDLLGGLIDGGVNSLIDYAIKKADPDNDGLTLVEFVEFVNSLSNVNGENVAELDASYLEQVTDVLTQVSKSIDVRIFLVNDGSDITPQQHGVYLVGVVSTDKNYNTFSDVGYLIITAEILDVKFVENNVENNIRKFEFDGSQKTMSAEAYDINKEVASGNMKYYYLGLQTDGTLYVSATAPVNAGTYSVYALFNNAVEGGLPSKVGFGIGAMLIIPSDDAEVVVNNAVHTYNGEDFDFKSMVSVNKADASLAYFTATINIDGDFSQEGFFAVDGSVNIDFPARFDIMLQKYLPEEYLQGINVTTFINLLNDAKVSIEEYGYSVEYIDNIIAMLEQIPNLVTVTFNDVNDINSSQIGAYLVGAVVFDPNYLPKANMGVLVIQPQVSESTLIWNYNDVNNVITVPALSKIDMGATVVNSADINVNYLYFGIDENGQLTKVANVKDITSGVWMQVAYIQEEVSANITVAMPIARIFVVVPQNVNVEINEGNSIICEYNGETHVVNASASYQDGTEANPEMVNITYVGVDNMGNRYYSNMAPVNAGVYTVIAAYIERNETTISYVGFATCELIITPADNEIIAKDKVVCYNEQQHNVEFEIQEGFEYITVIENNGRVNIILPDSWNITLDEEFNLVNILDKLKEFLPEDYLSLIQEITEKYEIEDILVNQSLPCEIGEYIVSVIAVNPNFKASIAQNTLTIKDHNLINHECKFATCTEIGWREYQTCSDCDYTTYIEIEALGHNEVFDDAVAATCQTTGLTEGYHCKTCGETLVAQVKIEKLPHTPSEWKTLKEATCTSKGLQYAECTECFEVLETRETNKVEHSIVYHEGEPATCTEKGYADYHTCDNCDYTTYIAIEALGHNEVFDDAVAATCQTMGLTEGSHCETCGKIFVEQEVVEKIAHDFGNWYVALQATATTDGYYERTCSACGHHETNVILAYGDENISDIEVSAGNDGKVSIDDFIIDEIIKNIEETDVKEIVIKTNNEETKLTSVEFNTSSLQQIVATNSSLTIETSEIHATFDKHALSAIVASANEEKVEFDLRIINNEQLNNQQRETVATLKVAEIISAQILCGNDVISSFGNGSVVVEVPFEIPEGKNASEYKIMYIADDGTIEELDTEYIDGKLIVEMKHFSEYVIVDITQEENSAILTNSSDDALIVAGLVVAGMLLIGVLIILIALRTKKKRLSFALKSIDKD